MAEELPAKPAKAKKAKARRQRPNAKAAPRAKAPKAASSVCCGSGSLPAPRWLLALLSLRGERKRAAYVAAQLAEPPPPDRTCPPATVIVPVKGDDPGLRENLAALAAQDYPDYELIVVAQCAADIPAGVLPSARAHRAGARRGTRHRRKVLNLRTAVRFARKDSLLFAFADSDGRVSRNWLRALAAPLAAPRRKPGSAPAPDIAGTRPSRPISGR